MKILLATSMILALACASASAGSSIAAMDKSTYVGGLIGAGFTSNDNSSSTNSNFGITVGTKLPALSNLGLGFYGTYAGDSSTASALGVPLGTSSRTYNLCGEVNGFVSVFHFGGDLGIGINSWDANAGNSSVGSSQTAMVFGPEAGFDIPLGATQLSLGGEVHYLLNTGDHMPNNLQALAALKVWL